MRNLKELLTPIEKYFDNWDDKPLSWFGQMNVIKMNIITCILYIFQTLPLPVPEPILDSLQATITKNIWQNKKVD